MGSSFHQDPLVTVETLLSKHKRREQGLKAQAEKISALEAAAHSLYQGGHSEAHSALDRCQALLLRYPRLWMVGIRGELVWTSTTPSSSLPALQLLGPTPKPGVTCWQRASMLSIRQHMPSTFFFMPALPSKKLTPGNSMEVIQ